MSNSHPENSDGFDVPDEALWEERFRDALTTGDELLIAKVLRRAKSLGPSPSTIETLATLFDGGADHGNGFENFLRIQIVTGGQEARKAERPFETLVS
jgi:hypothetical protein